jgi:hypothetical protein
MYREFQRRAEPLAEVLARRTIETSVTIDGQTERLAAEMVSGNYFTMLGVPAAIGRVFSSQEDDERYEGHPVVVVSHDYWMRRFNGDPAHPAARLVSPTRASSRSRSSSTSPWHGDSPPHIFGAGSMR